MKGVDTEGIVHREFGVRCEVVERRGRRKGGEGRRGEVSIDFNN